MYDVMRLENNMDISKLPSEKINPFKKRPVNLEYTMRDYATFYLPSEREYIFAGTLTLTQI